MSTDASPVEVRRNEDESRYEARVGDELAGFAAYALDAGHIVFTHTEVDDRFEGHGIGSALVRGALDDVRAHETRRVVAVCPFIRRWINRHPDYRDLTRR